MARKQHRTPVEETPVVTTEGDTDEFTRLALLAIDSTSRFEDRRVDNELEALCRRHLDKGEDSAFPLKGSGFPRLRRTSRNGRRLRADAA